MKKICYIATLGTTIESFFIPQMQRLAEEGFDVSLICSPDIPDMAEKLGDRIRYYPLPIPRGISFGGMLRAMREMERLFRRERFDLIQYSTPNAAFCAALAGKRTRIPLRNYHLMGLRYLSSHGVMRAALKAIESVTCALSTHIECVSKSNLQLGIREGLFDDQKACVVWNGSSGGVDLRRFDGAKREEYRREIRQKLGIAQEEFVFGFIGRITKDKGINELLTAYEKLGRGTLLLVGRLEGEERLDSVLLHRARENPKVIFTGQIPEAEVACYDCAMDVLLLPSYREGFGNVVIEAAAMGTGAIVSDIPGPTDAIEEGLTGATVPPADAAALEERMRDCLEGRICLRPEDCMDYVCRCFDSEKLCDKIVQRKKDLLEGKKLFSGRVGETGG